MTVSRRTFITSVAAGSTLAALGSSASAASPPGDVVGKVTVGYQGWFAATGDGAPINGWWHWSSNWGQPPSPSNTAIVSWPDMRDYTRGFQTAYANLGNGRPATLFSSYDAQTVDTHFRWMQENGCDTAALQRFNPFSGEGATRDAMAAKVRTAAEARGRKFYIMYDVTNWTNMQSEIKTDWTNKMKAHTASPAYAVQNGKPVVCIWGFGFNDAGRPFAPAPCLDVINWFKGQGCYVIGGVPTYWRQGINDSRAGFFGVYTAFNMISPWMVGRTGTLAGLDSFYTNVNVPDQAECNARGIDYQPCVMPGDLSTRGVRRHGDFYWRHIYNMVRLGAQGLYVSMFDEYNEGNQIAKTAESAAWIPAGSSFVTLDEDGTACSSDYYLRITADGSRMLKGLIPLTAVRPTQPTGGTPPDPNNIARGKPTSASSQKPNLVSANTVDGNTATYWEGNDNAFPQWVQVDLGASYAPTRVVLKLPVAWAARTQTLSVQGSADAVSFTTISPSAGYQFSPANANTVTINLTGSLRYLRINVTANTGAAAGQLAELEVFGSVVVPAGSSLRSRANNLYVSAVGTSPLIANKSAVGTTERFDVIDRGGGNIALRSRPNNMYVCAENAGAAPLVANRAAIGGWETFALVRNANGTVSLRAQANNMYVCAENAGAAALIANRTAIGPWEQFDLLT
ncbi:lectin [Rhizocola hellebori]|uniref:Lectin n=1 Tax=Rhizocola hellebori TaxID=1392758 RepID=A0A8J3VI18_9ACTN|nr:discoidin domain-containing protein [Rhizocola hellebori]GIH07120.1 lectin [Rhizocola hellebori]